MGGGSIAQQDWRRQNSAQLELRNGQQFYSHVSSFSRYGQRLTRFFCWRHDSSNLCWRTVRLLFFFSSNASCLADVASSDLSRTGMYMGGKTPAYGGATPFGGGSSTPFGAGNSTPYAGGKTAASGGNAFAVSFPACAALLNCWLNLLVRLSGFVSNTILCRRRGWFQRFFPYAICTRRSRRIRKCLGRRIDSRISRCTWHVRSMGCLRFTNVQCEREHFYQQQRCLGYCLSCTSKRRCCSICYWKVDSFVGRNCMGLDFSCL